MFLHTGNKHWTATRELFECLLSGQADGQLSFSHLFLSLTLSQQVSFSCRQVYLCRPMMSGSICAEHIQVSLKKQQQKKKTYYTRSQITPPQSVKQSGSSWGNSLALGSGWVIIRLHTGEWLLNRFQVRRQETCTSRDKAPIPKRTSRIINTHTHRQRKEKEDHDKSAIRGHKKK